MPPDLLQYALKNLRSVVEMQQSTCQALESYQEALSNYNNDERLPRERDYQGVVEYIEMKTQRDKFFAVYRRTHSMVELCVILTEVFGWDVSDHSLGERIRRSVKNS